MPEEVEAQLQPSCWVYVARRQVCCPRTGARRAPGMPRCMHVSQMHSASPCTHGSEVVEIVRLWIHTRR